jgi:hypothetical protein
MNPNRSTIDGNRKRAKLRTDPGKSVVLQHGRVQNCTKPESKYYSSIKHTHKTLDGTWVKDLSDLCHQGYKMRAIFSEMHWMFYGRSL